MGKTNKAILIGNFGDEMKMHYFEGGNCIGRVSMATSETYTNKQGEKVTSTEWHNLIFRNKMAETVSKYTGKGSKMYVEGRIKYRKYQDESGADKYVTEIHCYAFEFLSASPNKDQGQPRTGAGISEPSQEPHAGDQFLSGQTEKPKPETDNLEPEPEDDLPF